MTTAGHRPRTAPPHASPQSASVIGARSPLDGGPRNEGVPFDRRWALATHVNRSAVERRAATIPTRRTVKREIACLDLTTLSGDDTAGNVRRLCHKARQPVRSDLLEALGIPTDRIQVAAACVYHRWVETACAALDGSGIPVAAVSTGFPAGLTPLAQRIGEIRASLAAGAREIDVVITRAFVLGGQWDAMYEEVAAFRAACGAATLKVILGTGDLATLTNVARASRVTMMAGADFIKTSTGKEVINATLPVGVVMARAIRDYFEETGWMVGLKPAGGIRTAKASLEWLTLVNEELDQRWLAPTHFRIGASGLLTDIERQLEHFVSGRYSAAHRHPMV